MYFKHSEHKSESCLLSHSRNSTSFHRGVLQWTEINVLCCCLFSLYETCTGPRYLHSSGHPLFLGMILFSHAWIQVIYQLLKFYTSVCLLSWKENWKCEWWNWWNHVCSGKDVPSLSTSFPGQQRSCM